MRMKVGCNPIYMHMQMLMKCVCNDLDVLVHACILSCPPTMLLYFLLHGVIALALYKGLHAAEARPIQIGGSRAWPASLAPYG